MNECALENGGCEHHCTNNGGSFYCSCDAGYRLEPDGKRCRVPGTYIAISTLHTPCFFFVISAAIIKHTENNYNISRCKKSSHDIIVLYLLQVYNICLDVRYL